MTDQPNVTIKQESTESGIVFETWEQKDSESASWPTQCGCGRVIQEKYMFSKPTDDGAVGFAWCGYCRKKHMVYPPRIERLRTEHKAVRAVIAKHLVAMSDDLEQFSMTTHSAMATGSIKSLADALVECVVNPDPYRISNLYQHIRKLTEL